MIDCITFDRLDRSSWLEWRDYPLPAWCEGAPALLGGRAASLGDAVKPDDVAVCSVCFDGTASTRIGARNGPAAVRKASLFFSAQASSRRIADLTHLRTGARVGTRTLALADFGDLHVFPTDPARQVRATAAEVFEIAHRAKTVVILGGEHTISYPAFAAVAKATPAGPLGYVQIDHHFDFGEHSVLHGHWYHGSNARRIAEIPGMARNRMGFVGQGDLTGTEQLAALVESGCTVRHRGHIRRIGYPAALRETLDRVAERSPGGLYVSIDVDVCDCSVAPGTGHVTIGGLSADEFMSTAEVLQEYPVRALDLVEVSPALDPSGRTGIIAARLLYEFLLLDWRCHARDVKPPVAVAESAFAPSEYAMLDRL